MLKLNNLSFAYGDKTIFDAVDLDFAMGKIHCLLGKNGVGKTTLLKLIAGLYKPSAGECLIDDKNILLRDPDTLSELFYLPDSFELPEVDINTYANLYGHFYPNFDYQQFQTLLNDFEIDNNTTCDKFSHGNKMKALLAFALATNCKYVLLDESINGLDIYSKKLLRKMLVSSITADKLFILSTHQLNDINNIFDQVIILDNKKIILNKTMDELELELSNNHNGSIENLYIETLEKNKILDKI